MPALPFVLRCFASSEPDVEAACAAAPFDDALTSCVAGASFFARDGFEDLVGFAAAGAFTAAGVFAAAGAFAFVFDFAVALPFLPFDAAAFLAVVLGFVALLFVADDFDFVDLLFVVDFFAVVFAFVVDFDVRRFDGDLLELGAPLRRLSDRIDFLTPTIDLTGCWSVATGSHEANRTSGNRVLKPHSGA